VHARTVADHRPSGDILDPLRPRDLIVLFAVGCAAPALPLRAPSNAAGGVADSRLAWLLTRHWEWRLQHAPLLATELGDHRFDDRIESHAWDAHERERADARQFLDEARRIDRASLSAADRVHHALFLELVESELATTVCREELWNVSTFDNAVVRWNELAQLHAVRTVEDGRHFLRRLRLAGAAVDEEIANLRRGLAEGRVAGAGSIRRSRAQVAAQLERREVDWPLFAPARAPHPGWPPFERARFASELGEVLREIVRPAFARYAALLDELEPRGRDDAHAGVGALPDGARCYDALIRYHTGLGPTAEELHRLGLLELARLDAARAQMARPPLYFHDADEIVARAEAALASARAAAPRFFATLPRTAVVVKPSASRDGPIANYQPAPPGEDQPAEYRINILSPSTRRRGEAAVLAAHEAIPGHHLQIARAQELPALPAFRRHLLPTAFTEGWALYAERLAGEMGLYTDDDERLGQLDYDAWRASRLVVDTGLHAFGWSRARAVAFLIEHTALPRADAENEVERYLAWPAQALSYKVGQWQIARLRRRAEEALGARFDLRAFHDAILGGGAVTLPVLEQQVEEWISTR
jgi:uncharacterized protein (DUF885 family)